MIEYPIENRTKRSLWFDVDYKNQRLYIHEYDGIYEPEKDVLIDPGETVFIHFYVKQSDYHIVDKNGKRLS